MRTLLVLGALLGALFTQPSHAQVPLPLAGCEAGYLHDCELALRYGSLWPPPLKVRVIEATRRILLPLKRSCATGNVNDCDQLLNYRQLTPSTRAEVETLRRQALSTAAARAAEQVAARQREEETELARARQAAQHGVYVGLEGCERRILSECVRMAPYADSWPKAVQERALAANRKAFQAAERDCGAGLITVCDEMLRIYPTGSRTYNSIFHLRLLVAQGARMEKETTAQLEARQLRERLQREEAERQEQKRSEQARIAEELRRKLARAQAPVWLLLMEQWSPWPGLVIGTALLTYCIIAFIGLKQNRKQQDPHWLIQPRTMLFHLSWIALASIAFAPLTPEYSDADHLGLALGFFFGPTIALLLAFIVPFVLGYHYLFVRHPAAKVALPALRTGTLFDNERLADALEPNPAHFRHHPPEYQSRDQLAKARLLRERIEEDGDLAEAAMRRDRARAAAARADAELRRLKRQHRRTWWWK